MSNKFNMNNLLQSIYRTLEDGNQAMQWIQKYKQGKSIQEIMKYTIMDMIEKEKD